MLRSITEPQTYSPADWQAYQAAVGDTHPLHFDATYAATTPFGHILIPGFYLVWRAEREGKILSDSNGLQVDFSRELRAALQGQEGDVVQFAPSDGGGQYLRTRDGTTKTAFTMTAAGTATLDKAIGDYPLQHRKTFSADALGDLADGRIPYAVALGLIAPALREMDAHMLAAYRAVTVHTHAERPHVDSTLVALARYERRTEQRGTYHDFAFTVTGENFAPIVSGTVKLFELRALEKAS